MKTNLSRAPGERSARRRGARRATPAFSIIETLVAISILTLAVTGPMAFAQSSLRAAAYARDQAIAFFLAQDAVEFVKHVRDENSLTDLRADWLSGLASCLGAECMVSSADVAIGDGDDDSLYAEPCQMASPPPASCRLWIEDQGFDPSYLYGTAGQDRTPSKFIRTVRIDPAPGMDETDEVQVSVKIYWRTHPLLPAREIDVRENIMNWIQ